MVVEFAIVDDSNRVNTTGNRLGSGFHVDNGQTDGPKLRPFSQIFAAIVGTAVIDRRHHPTQCSRMRERPGTAADNANYSAH